MSVSTHVLDAASGLPAIGLAVTLSYLEHGPQLEHGPGDEHGAFVTVAEARTDADGRVPDLCAATPAGVYRLRFDIEGYAGAERFYPEVVVTFRVTDPAAHHHVPLLLSPFAYSTYRGS